MQRPRRKSNGELQNYGRIRDVSKQTNLSSSFAKKATEKVRSILPIG